MVFENLINNSYSKFVFACNNIEYGLMQCLRDILILFDKKIWFCHSQVISEVP